MLIKPAQHTRTYELTYLLPPVLTSTEAGEVKKAITDLVKRHHGEILETQEWGKKSLAYSLKHAGKTHTEAEYVHLRLTFKALEANAFEKDVNLNQSLMRHLMVVVDLKKEKAVLAEKTAKQAPAEAEEVRE